MQLVRPAAVHLPSYVAALERGWSSDNVRGRAAAEEELARIRESPEQFLEALDDRDGKGPPITLPDGSSAQRLPGFRKWMWADEFVGSIGLRWQRGTAELPPHVLGHIGYAVVPWHRRKGYATAALIQLLGEARALGLPYVEVTTDPLNIASRKVVERAGGVLHEVREARVIRRHSGVALSDISAWRVTFRSTPAPEGRAGTRPTHWR